MESERKMGVLSVLLIVCIIVIAGFVWEAVVPRSAKEVSMKCGIINAPISQDTLMGRSTLTLDYSLVVDGNDFSVLPDVTHVFSVEVRGANGTIIKTFEGLFSAPQLEKGWYFQLVIDWNTGKSFLSPDMGG